MTPRWLETEMIDLMTNMEPEVTLFLERITGGPKDDSDGFEDDVIDVFFAMAGSQVGDKLQRPVR